MLCPNGHESTATDWCETCGMRMPAPPSSSYSSRPPSSAASSSSTPPVSPQPAFGYDPAGAGGQGSGQLCPACGTPREGMALFCEECRYNFQTHSATTFVPQPPHITPTAPDRPPYQRYDSQLSRPSRVNRPAEPLPSESVTVTSGSGDFLLDPPSAATAAPAPPHGPASSPAAPQPAPGRGTAWLAVIAADREYFTAVMARSGPDASGLYFPAFSPEFELPLTGHQITIGRQRHSTREAPDIDLSRAPEDPGVSHKHAVLVQQPDGSWSVVDQDSTNGTTVNLAEDPIPAYTPIPLAEGDRVHVGAWTTITIRRI
ncbi:FHA domain-containing protein [Streptomyces sp. NBC_00433]